jgi:signal transduction histidine kinase
VAFSVSDTGIGIPPDRLPLIFDKFRQLDGSTSRRYSGTGLGLTIAKNLADLIGGKLEVLSEPGKGSTFAVVIPVAESAAAVTSGLGGGASERNVRSG